jgi:hypothetical protein
MLMGRGGLWMGLGCRVFVMAGLEVGVRIW